MYIYIYTYIYMYTYTDTSYISINNSIYHTHLLLNEIEWCVV